MECPFFIKINNYKYVSRSLRPCLCPLFISQFAHHLRWHPSSSLFHPNPNQLPMQFNGSMADDTFQVLSFIS